MHALFAATVYAPPPDKCSQGKAWLDYATATDTAHADAECSMMGHCQETANATYIGGACVCRAGFEGIACERSWCPGVTSSTNIACSGKGRCLSMAEASVYEQHPNSPLTFAYANWDADKIMGCVCDDGYTGYDCSERTCPFGDDPETTGQADEVQVLNCMCQSTCSGSFTITFRGQTTAAIAHGASTAAVGIALEALTTIDDITIAVRGSSGSTACDADGVSHMITFTTEHGDLPAMTVTSSLASSGGTPALTVTSGE